MQAIPIAAPSGWWGSSVNEGLQSGLALFDAARGEVILRDRGGEIPDSYYLLWQEVSGDFQATVKVLPLPNAGQPARVSLMVRESVETDGRYVSADTGASRWLDLGWRDAFGPGKSGELTLQPGTVKLPILLRLTRTRTVERAAVAALLQAVEQAAAAGNEMAQLVKSGTPDSLLWNLAHWFDTGTEAGRTG